MSGVGTAARVSRIDRPMARISERSDLTREMSREEEAECMMIMPLKCDGGRRLARNAAEQESVASDQVAP